MCLRRLRLRLRLRWWRTVNDTTARPDLPSSDHSRLLADWLRGPRSRALRRAGIGARESVLEAGSGRGVVTGELQRRAAGQVVSLDRDPAALAGGDYPDGALRVAGDCCALPFPDARFDLAFFQNVLMWIPDAARAVSEATRTLRPGGALVAIEPDYGAMIEHPDVGLRELWMAGLSRSGADPLVGRKLPGVCEAAGLDVWVELSHLPQTAQPQAVELLTDLPLDEDERARADEAMAAVAGREGSWTPLLHLPYFLIVATR